MFRRLEIALQKTWSFRSRRAKSKSDFPLTAAPKGFEFFDVEGVPVVLTRPPGKIPFAMAYDPGKPPRPFPFESVMRNGSLVDEARFRAIAGLPARLPRKRNLKQCPKNPGLEAAAKATMARMLVNLNRAAEQSFPVRTRPVLPSPEAIKQGPKDPRLEDPAITNLMLANLNKASLAHRNGSTADDGTPVLFDDDPVHWNTAAAVEAARLAAVAIAHAARHTDRQPLASVADDGRAFVLDAGWAASRDASGNWTRGIHFTFDDMKDQFRIVSDNAASKIASEARAALH